MPFVRPDRSGALARVKVWCCVGQARPQESSQVASASRVRSTHAASSSWQSAATSGLAHARCSIAKGEPRLRQLPHPRPKRSHQSDSSVSMGKFRRVSFDPVKRRSVAMVGRSTSDPQNRQRSVPDLPDCGTRRSAMLCARSSSNRSHHRQGRSTQPRNAAWGSRRPAIEFWRLQAVSTQQNGDRLVPGQSAKALLVSWIPRTVEQFNVCTHLFSHQRKHRRHF